MSEEIVPCPVVSWCTGHSRWEIEHLASEEIAHVSKPEMLLDECLVFERTLLAGEGREYYSLWGDMTLDTDADELESLAVSFDEAAARIRQIARSVEVNNGGRSHE